MATADIETVRALYGASRCRARWRTTRIGPVYERLGRTVYYARPNRPYGRSTQARAYLTHIPAHVYVAWRGGRIVGQLVRWRCGGDSKSFEFTVEPTSPLCPVCLAGAIGRPNTRVLLERGCSYG
jgi:hypothetical protein